MELSSIPFNKPFLTGKEIEYIRDAVSLGKISGNGKYTNLCHQYFFENYGFKKCLLTCSCTDALEMAAILLDIKNGDEVIMPSYTFVSTANAFVLRGAKIIFADSNNLNPNIDADEIEKLINKNTRAIVVVHYAGISCDMDAIVSIAKKHKVKIIEDAAQAIDSYYLSKDGKKYPLGSFGDMAAFSFHETKNIISGEGGMLVVNNPGLEKRAEIIWEKGTNRSAFFRGEVDKYNWVDIGSSFLPSDIIAAFLFAQLEQKSNIQSKRVDIWNRYYQGLSQLQDDGLVYLPHLPGYATNNAHMFYIVCKNAFQRDHLIATLKANNILAVFHYLSLHKSPFYNSFHDNGELIFSDLYSDRLIRLPFYYELEMQDQQKIIDCIKEFFLSIKEKHDC